MATLREIVNSVLTETGYPELDTVVGNGSNTARRMLSLANRSGKTLSRKDWTILIKRNVITVVPNAESYVFPSDFDRFVDNTHWNLDEAQRLDGPITTQAWQASHSGMVGAITINDRWQVRADGNQSRFFLDPIPSVQDEISFYYIANTWCRANGGTRQAYWKADNDVLLLDSFIYELDLIWRWLRANRRPYAEEYSECMRETDKAFARDGGMEVLRILGPIEDWVPMANVGEAGFGS